MEIKNIIFDMGNVLTTFNLRDYLRNYVETEEDFQIMKKEVCQSVEWLMMDRGTITDEEAILSICQRVPKRLYKTVQRYICEYRMEQPPNPPMEQLVYELSQNGYRLFLLSNTSHRFRVFSKKIKSIDYMEGIWISCEHRLLKPDLDAYRDFLQEFSLQPEECFFIDDTVANIESAMYLGIRGHVFDGNVDTLRRVLKKNGVKL